MAEKWFPENIDQLLDERFIFCEHIIGQPGYNETTGIVHLENLKYLKRISTMPQFKEEFISHCKVLINKLIYECVAQYDVVPGCTLLETKDYCQKMYNALKNIWLQIAGHEYNGWDEIPKGKQKWAIH